MTNTVPRLLHALSASCVVAALSGCGPAAGDSIQNKGSDTMLEVAQSWAEAYYPRASVEVSGGGSGVGISALIAGTVDIANCSRTMKEEEIAKAEAHEGGHPVEYTVGYDALAIYVHKDNPIEEISMEELKEVFGEGGEITKWSELGVEVAGCGSDTIQLAGRQSSSGTYEYFRESVLGKQGKYRLNINEQNGSRALVQFVGNTPCAIGYSGMGYKTDRVKFVKVKVDSKAAIPPSAKAVHDGTYPIARPLFMYTPAQPAAHVKDYIDWVRGPEAQAMLEKIGYVPLPEEEQTGPSGAAGSAPR